LFLEIQRTETQKVDMQTYSFDAGIRRIAITSISGYQKYLSPHKGFACAHRLLHRGQSCSEYAKQTIDRQGLLVAIPLLRQRFADCKFANQTLKARVMHIEETEEEPINPDNSDKKRSHSSNRNSQTCNCEGCEYLVIPDLSDCCLADHASGLDCGGADCGSGLDCGGADCGSCSW
jgi:putative component of membrane protein insertase Oxa1/YidC/SpoIIIJ protein YidD